mgnify:CR=1 FL=1
MRQPPPWTKSGVRLPLAFSTIPFEAPPAEEQAHRLRLVFLAAQSRKWCWILFSFLFFFLRSAGGARAGASLVPVILIHCLSKFLAIASWRILFQNHAPRHRTTLSATVCALCGRSPCNQGKLASSSTKTPLFFKGVDCMHSVFVFVCGPKVSLIFSNNITWDKRHLIIKQIQSCYCYITYIHSNMSLIGWGH